MLKAHNTTLQLQIHCAQEFTHRHICIMHPIITVFQAPLAFSLAHDRNQNWWWTRLAEFLEFGTELEQSELVYGFASTTVGLFFAQLPSYLCYLLLHCCLMLSFAVSCHTYTLLHILHIIAACMVHGAGAGQGIKYLRSHTQHHSARNNRSIFPIVLAASFFSLYIISSSTCSCSILPTLISLTLSTFDSNRHHFQVRSKNMTETRDRICNQAIISVSLVSHCTFCFQRQRSEQIDDGDGSEFIGSALHSFPISNFVMLINLFKFRLKFKSPKFTKQTNYGRIN